MPYFIQKEITQKEATVIRNALLLNVVKEKEVDIEGHVRIRLSGLDPSTPLTQEEYNRRYEEMQQLRNTLSRESGFESCFRFQRLYGNHVGTFFAETLDEALGHLDALKIYRSFLNGRKSPENRSTRTTISRVITIVDHLICVARENQVRIAAQEQATRDRNLLHLQERANLKLDRQYEFKFVLNNNNNQNVIKIKMIDVTGLTSKYVEEQMAQEYGFSDQWTTEFEIRSFVKESNCPQTLPRFGFWATLIHGRRTDETAIFDTESKAYEFILSNLVPQITRDRQLRLTDLKTQAQIDLITLSALANEEVAA